MRHQYEGLFTLSLNNELKSPSSTTLTEVCEKENSVSRECIATCTQPIGVAVAALVSSSAQEFTWLRGMSWCTMHLRE